jgi:hypothetical protein
MHWIALSEKDADNAALEKRLWDAAEQFRANSRLKSKELSIHGVEKTDETDRLCRLNLAVHGLEGAIRHGGNVNSYYDDPRDATGRLDFVLANPPFNVNAVDTAMRVSARPLKVNHFLAEGSPRKCPTRYGRIEPKIML